MAFGSGHGRPRSASPNRASIRADRRSHAGRESAWSSPPSPTQRDGKMYLLGGASDHPTAEAPARPYHLRVGWSYTSRWPYSLLMMRRQPEGWVEE